MSKLRSTVMFVIRIILIGILCCKVSSKSSPNNISSIAPSHSNGGSQPISERNGGSEGRLSRSTTTIATDQIPATEANGTTFHTTFDNATDHLDIINGKGSKKRTQFLNRIAMVSSMLLRQEEATLVDEDFLSTNDDEEITPQSDLSRPGRHIHLVTTASLPWFTVSQQFLHDDPLFMEDCLSIFVTQGTAVNPLLRAAYLHDRMQQINSAPTNSTKEVKSWVTLVIPWLELEEDQKKLYNDRVFSSQQEQEEFVREWLATQAKMPSAADNLNIVFYNARYHAGLGSVFAMGDIIKQLPPDELDVCILEEPEVCSNFSADPRNRQRTILINSQYRSMSIGSELLEQGGRNSMITSLESFIQITLSTPPTIIPACGQLRPSESYPPL